mmetsp:Transcript_11104/g.31255  ORF Transcript_11104/g.31255 Transcript_11104/m.31255 type:complete len:968 (+) Transcript_11104:461-3364(+)
MTIENSAEASAGAPPPTIMTDDAVSTSSPASVSSTPSAATAMSVKDRVRLMNVGKNRMLLEQAAAAASAAAAALEVQKANGNVDATKAEVARPAIKQDDHDDGDDASVCTHNTQSTYGSYRKAFASDSSWIGRRKNATSSRASSSQKSKSEEKIPMTIRFGDTKNKVREHQRVQQKRSSEEPTPQQGDDDISAGADSSAAVDASGSGTGSSGQGRPGRLRVPPAFLTGGASTAGGSIISPLSMSSADNAAAMDSSTSRKVQQAPAPPSRKEAMLLDRKKKLNAAIKAPTAASASASASALPQPSTALAHADERRKVLEKRRRMRQKIKATQQLQHQMAMEAAERNRARTEIVDVPAAASAESGGQPQDGGGRTASTNLLSPASECSIECIFKDEVAPTEAARVDADQPTANKPPIPPLPSKSLSVRPDPTPQMSLPPSTGAGPAALDPTSPPRVTRSPMSGLMRPTLDDTNASALPSLELSPIRRPEIASSDNSNAIRSNEVSKTNNTGNDGAGESPSFRGRGSTGEAALPPVANTPDKAQGTMPPSRDNTPKIANRSAGIHRSSSSGMLSHPVSVLPKDLPSGKPRKKPAGLPLSPTKTTDDASAPSMSVNIGTGADQRNHINPSKSLPTETILTNNQCSSQQAQIGVASADTQETPAASKPESVATSSVHTDATDNQSENLLNESGDSLLSWLGKQSDNDTLTSTKEGLLKNVDNLDPEKKEPLSVRSSGRSTRSQSLDVISEGQPHQPQINASSFNSSPTEHQQQQIAARSGQGIGSFMSMLSSAYNGLKIDNALDGVMEVVAEGVDKGYKEVSNITTNFLDGPGRATSTQPSQAQKRSNVHHHHQASAVRSPSPGIGPIQIEISRSFNPRIVDYDNDENATVGSRVSALTFETYEDYVSITSLSPARATSTTNRRTPRGLQMTYSEEKTSNKDGATGKVGGTVPTVKEEETWQPFEKERRFFA